MKLSELPVNPFDDNVVFEPREAEHPIAGLNDRPLAVLLRQFERLEAEPLPRRRPLRLKAQLATSAEPGYGKSHLIGRLFKELGERAHFVAGDVSSADPSRMPAHRGARSCSRSCRSWTGPTTRSSPLPNRDNLRNSTR